MLDEIKQAIASVKEKGLDKAAFEAAKRASFGARLRGLEDFDSLCLALADGVFGGYCFLDCFDVLEGVGIEECEAFLTEFMAPDRLAMSVISPVK